MINGQYTHSSNIRVPIQTVNCKYTCINSKHAKMLVIRNYSLLYYKTSAGRSNCMLEVALK